VDFVGPWSGTTKLPAAVPAGYPDVPVPPNHSGAYRPGITFTESQNYAQWGWQLHQAKDVVNGTVSTYQPDYLVVELGFNDLGWSVSSPSGLADDLRTFVANARAAKPNLKIIVGNVVHRTPLDAAPDLPQKITEYDASLGSVVSSLSTATSPVVMADLDTPYDENQHTYDGLHPNGVGEYVLAKAFATCSRRGSASARRSARSRRRWPACSRARRPRSRPRRPTPASR
jgi:lysophospholipase L1-like esterase